MAELDSWIEAQEFQITLDAQGKIIDFLDPEIKRPNTPEERIRQKMVQIIVCELGYAHTFISFGASFGFAASVASITSTSTLLSPL